MSIYHIIPINDLKEHEDCSTCHCHPDVSIEEGDIFIVHNSYDGREIAEDFVKNIKDRMVIELLN
jgi:hypothetical protein